MHICVFGYSPSRGPKKPAGAVSIFPTGVDPFKKKEAEVKKEDTPKIQEPVTRPPAKSISMFDDDEEDLDGDLFGGGAAPKPPAQKQVGFNFE